MNKANDAFEIEGLRGLSERDAAALLVSEGANELPTQKKRGLLAVVIEVLREPMFIMLVAAGIVYLLLGAAGDALLLLGFVFVVMAITVVQSRRTERALDALRDLSSPRALVIRDGERRRIAGKDVVRGDLVIVGEGDRVPADGVVRQALHLAVDESLLTGEAVAVRKRADAGAATIDKPGGDDLPSVFSGTLVTSGQGVVEVLATGAGTEFGKIGKALARTPTEVTTLQQETRRIVRVLAITGLASCVVVVVAFALTRGGGAAVWKEGFLAGIALAMAVLPEEFPVVLTIFLALGAWRLSRSHVLTRQMPAIEMLGAASVLCVDKTGTLTKNQMTLRALSVGSDNIDIVEATTELPEVLHGLLEHSILASKRDPFDSMERALIAAGDRFVPRTEHLHPDFTLVREYPLSPQLLAVSHAWRRGGGEAGVVVSCKGAPEAVADLCHLDAARRASLAAEVLVLASRGLRVLAVARGVTEEAALPKDHHDLTLELVGLLGFEDPLRPTVPAAVAECQSAGVRVVMITGDYPATAQSIARQAGISDVDTVITGQELDALTDEQLAGRVGHTGVFARVVPEQKLRIVNALKANDDVVAMTGDGVNDAPALKAAHIGIAMGERGTDVAREAAALVLLNDDFSSIVEAIRLGRRITDNIQRAIVFIVAVHVPIAGLSIVPVFFASWPLLLLPVHIAFLQLIIDPACTLIFEAERPADDVMKRKPRARHTGLFNKQTVGLALLQGASVFVACLSVFVVARSNVGDDAARALAWVTLVVAFVVVILVNRSWTQSIVAMLRVPNPAVRWVLAGAAVILGVSVFAPFARTLFHFAPVGLRDVAGAVVVGAVCVLWFEVVKWARRLRTPNGEAQAPHDDAATSLRTAQTQAPSKNTAPAA